MIQYDLIVIGTGSAMTDVEVFLHQKPDGKVAVVEKDQPGGICLTRGCIPSKMLLYPAEVLEQIRRAGEFGIEAEIREFHSTAVFDRMRLHTYLESTKIQESLAGSDAVDFYQGSARFTGRKELEVDVDGKRHVIAAPRILLCTGSRPAVPHIDGLDPGTYLTSDTLLELKELPVSIAVIGGGYIACEYAHLLAAFGVRVVLIGRNPQLLPEEEPEISTLVEGALAERMAVHTGRAVSRLEHRDGGVRIFADDGEFVDETETVLVAAGRESNADLLDPRAGGLAVDDRGWLKVDEYLETSIPGVYAFGDALGHHMFKHAANWEAQVAYVNAFGDAASRTAVDYHAVPHAVFTSPEVASVGMSEAEAVRRYGEEGIVVGLSPFAETAKGRAMRLLGKRYFVKALCDAEYGTILGAHIVGPQASILIQEIVNLMYVGEGVFPIRAQHIHPALSEVVQNAFANLGDLTDYRHELQHLLTGTEHHDHE